MKRRTRFKLPKIIIVGSGRSGTTLLTSMLNASEQLYIPYESDFIARAYPYFCDKASFNDYDYRLITKLFKLTAKQEGWGMTEKYLFSYLQRKSPQSFAEVNSTVCEAFHEKEGTENLEWGIKAPVLIASLDKISNVCPDSKITHIVRDGRDVYLSYKKIHESSQIKFGPKGVFESALYWVDGLRRVENFSNNKKNISVFEIRYKDLLFEPGKQLKQLCEFLSIKYKRDMYERFSEIDRNRKIVPNQFKQNIHKKLDGGLDPNNTEKYLSKISKFELIRFELIAAPYLAKYGYQLKYPFLKTFWFTPLRSILYALARIFNDWRYARRDRKMYHQASKFLQSERQETLA